MRVRAIAAAALVVLTAAACTVHQTEAPPLAGPSEFSTSIVLTASPDAIQLDGADRSTIAITARGPDGRGVRGLSFRVDTYEYGTAIDIGNLSARTVTTNSDGVATVIYTAPLASLQDSSASCNGLPGRCVTVVAAPIGSTAGDFATVIPRSVTIRLIPVGVILPPAGTPVPAFVFTPTPAIMGVPLTFDASSSLPGTNAYEITSYAWSFGDGTKGEGETVSHRFGSTGDYVVTLTVTSDRGMSASTTQTISVDPSDPPVPVIDISPKDITTSTLVQFSGLQSTAATGRTIVRYEWNFGDPNNPARVTGSTATHQYALANTYTVTLTVTDDIGVQSSVTKDVIVK
jgi:PKD repeat protein